VGTGSSGGLWARHALRIYINYPNPKPGLGYKIDKKTKPFITGLHWAAATAQDRGISAPKPPAPTPEPRDMWLQVNRCSIPVLVGAVGLAGHTRDDPDSGQMQVELEIHFPPEASAAYPCVWLPIDSHSPVKFLDGDPRTAPFTLSSGDARALSQIAVKGLFNALEQDLFPPEDYEKIFGCEMGSTIGGLVRNTWDRLFRFDLISGVTRVWD